MPGVTRTTDVIEIHWENALIYGAFALACFGLGGLVYHYENSAGGFLPLEGILGGIGLLLILLAIRRAILVRHVTSITYTCPYCAEQNELTDIASTDFTCSECHRLVPIIDGEIIPVEQVRCGYCNTLNYYSEKTEFLICEECNREIPIHAEDGDRREIAGYLVQDDDNSLYELILKDSGPKTEEVMECLQRMLALNRNQVRQMLTETPVVLLTGIPKRKAVILQAQLESHDAMADARSLV
jgi:ribosomal protein L37AE/L43A